MTRPLLTLRNAVGQASGGYQPNLKTTAPCLSARPSLGSRQLLSRSWHRSVCSCRRRTSAQALGGVGAAPPWAQACCAVFLQDEHLGLRLLWASESPPVELAPCHSALCDHLSELPAHLIPSPDMPSLGGRLGPSPWTLVPEWLAYGPQPRAPCPPAPRALPARPAEGHAGRNPLRSLDRKQAFLSRFPLSTTSWKQRAANVYAAAPRSDPHLPPCAWARTTDVGEDGECQSRGSPVC